MKKFNSEVEKKEYFRQKQADRRAARKGEAVNVKPRESLTDVPLSVYADGEVMTETDRLFEAKHPNYYVYEKGEREVQCHQCHKKFRTRMMLLRFCSPECQHLKLSSFSTVGLGSPS